MRSPGDILVGSNLLVAHQRVAGAPGQPVSPEKDSPPHRSPYATRFATRRQRAATRKDGCATWDQTTYHLPWFSRKKENAVRMMSVAESADLHPIDVNASSSAVVVKAECR
jgi:hypothetical protein